MLQKFQQRFIVFSFQDQPPLHSYLMVAAGRIKCSILKENMIETSQTLTFETLIFENIINISKFSVYHLSLIFIFLVEMERKRTLAKNDVFTTTEIYSLMECNAVFLAPILSPASRETLVRSRFIF